MSYARTPYGIPTQIFVLRIPKRSHNLKSLILKRIMNENTKENLQTSTVFLIFNKVRLRKFNIVLITFRIFDCRETKLKALK